MISDGQETYAVAGFPSVHNHSYFDPRTNAYTLVGKDLQVPLPINGRAMCKAGDVIFVAGEPMKFEDPTWEKYVAAYNGQLGGRLLAISAADGKQLAEYQLPSAVVWDSIAVAQGESLTSLSSTAPCSVWASDVALPRPWSAPVRPPLAANPARTLKRPGIGEAVT